MIQYYKHISVTKNDTGRGGGISIFVKEDIEFLERQDLRFSDELQDSYDSLFIEVQSGNANIPDTLIGTIYRSPSYANEKQLIRSMEILLNKIHNEKKEIILLGDFNMDLMTLDDNTSDMLDLLVSSELIPRITVPTRKTHDSQTLIDHIYKKISNQKCTAGTLISDITDHYINFIFSSEPNVLPPLPKSITYRAFTENNLNSFNDQLRQTDWSQVYSSNDPNEAYKCFIGLYLNAFNQTIPIKTKKFNKWKHKKQRWMTRGILTSIKNKTKLYKIKMQATNEQAIAAASIKYNNYRNMLNKVIRKATKTSF